MVDKLIAECTENIDEVKIGSKSEHENKCSFCTMYILLFSIIFTITLELVFILIAINTWIVTNKMFLNLILSSKQQIININGKYQTN